MEGRQGHYRGAGRAQQGYNLNPRGFMNVEEDHSNAVPLANWTNVSQG